MAFHLCAFTESIGNLTNEDIAALNDDVLAISNGHFLPQRDYDVAFAALLGPNMDRGRLVSPTNRQITLPFVRPINVAALPATDPNMADYRDTPFRLAGLEEFALEVSTNAAGPSRITGLVGIMDRLDPVPAGNVFTMRGTSTTAAVANAWTTIVVTWADILPAGVYAIVGMEVQSTNGQAARLILENWPWRPGGVSVNALGNRTHWMFYKGGLGSWGRFRSTRMPIVQVLANAADAAHEIYLDIVRIPGVADGSL
jgi:hypothetical protein